MISRPLTPSRLVEKNSTIALGLIQTLENKKQISSDLAKILEILNYNLNSVQAVLKQELVGKKK